MIWLMCTQAHFTHQISAQSQNVNKATLIGWTNQKYLNMHLKHYAVYAVEVGRIYLLFIYIENDVNFLTEIAPTKQI